jgi:hypothetical protein
MSYRQVLRISMEFSRAQDPRLIPRQNRTAMATVERLVQAVTIATGIHVGFGLLPDNLLANTRVEIGAEGGLARETLGRTLAATGQVMSWQLLYNPSEAEGAYFLSVHTLKNADQ